jgi:hypothetical protein
LAIQAIYKEDGHGTHGEVIKKETQSEPMGRNKGQSFVYFFPLVQTGFLPLPLILGPHVNHLSNSSI